jgi:soluble lytic murein transglycosylase-like protein
MVRVACIAITFGLLASSAAAAPNWRDAGGGLFANPPDTSASNLQHPVRSDGEFPDAHAARVPDPDQPFSEAVARAAAAHGLDPKLLHALVVVESAYRPRARSPVGAGGLTQLMPATAAALGVRDRFDPKANLAAGADYLARQLLRFGDLRLALAAYNAGPGRVAALGHIPDIAETRAYVGAVVDCYLALSAGRGVRTAKECRPTGGLP